MNVTVEPLVEPLIPDNLSPDAIALRLGDLIRLYVRTRSPTTALSVVRHIEKLCNHPAFEGNAADRCSYLRLKTHWLWLAKSAPEGSAA